MIRGDWDSAGHAPKMARGRKSQQASPTEQASYSSTNEPGGCVRSPGSADLSAQPTSWRGSRAHRTRRRPTWVSAIRTSSEHAECETIPSKDEECASG